VLELGSHCDLELLVAHADEAAGTAEVLLLLLLCLFLALALALALIK
jgi:hypothetical protein